MRAPDLAHAPAADMVGQPVAAHLTRPADLLAEWDDEAGWEARR